MKENLRTLIMIVLFSTSVVIAVAQENQIAVRQTPKWISDKGYWVVKSNIKTPKTSIVYFYNNENILVYSEKVEGVKLNIKKTQTCMRLKKVLDQSLTAWEKMHEKNNEQLVKNMFKVGDRN